MSSTFSFGVGTQGSVTATVYRAAQPMEATLILAHGAGAPQSHPFMVGMAVRLAARGVDVVTFDFLYTTQGRKLPDRNESLEACWRAAIANVRARGGLPTERLFIGGKSMGGRIATQIAAANEGLAISGVVLLGYPLHPPKKPKLRRDEHLRRLPFPCLFVQGTRDPLGTAKEITALARTMPSARVHVVEDGDHSLALAKRGRRGRDGDEAQENALASAADAIAAFASRT